MIRYYRTDLSGWDDAIYPKTVKICSAGELAVYYEKNKHTYQFQQGYYGGPSMTDDVFGRPTRFGEGFFENRFLLFVIIEEGSGSIRHRVESAQPEKGALSVEITRIIPEVGTADMAQWHIVLDIDKKLADIDVAVIICDEYFASH